MESSFDPHALEQSLYREWEQAGYFEPSGNGKPYCIMIPPPNVTGSLHMGHAFQHTIMDTLIRYRRMKGENTLWQMGTDHAGIATQMLVERQLNAQGITKAELGRDAFVEKVWEWKDASGGTHLRTDPPHGLVARLEPRTLHDGRRFLATRCAKCSCVCTTTA